MTDWAASGASANFATEVTQEVAASWIARWDAQQTRYIADREERFAVIGDVVARAIDNVMAPVVLDIGCGPGSLASRLASRSPHAVVLGLDIDPLLLALGRARYGHRVHFIDSDVTAAGWAHALDPVEVIDAAVSTTALHWMPPEQLARLYVDLAALLRPGGILVNGNNLTLDQHVAMLRVVGFTTIGPIWQSGTDHVLVAQTSRG